MRSVPNELAMSLFAHKRLRDERLRKILLKQLLKNKNNFANCKANIKKSKNSVIFKSTVTQLKINREIVTPRPWNLPPNQYNIKDIVKRPEGYKGSYISQLERTESTIITHSPPIEELKIFQFYEKPGVNDKLNDRCNKFKGIFGSNPRYRKASSRFMVKNNIGNTGSPRLGPTTYFTNSNDPKVHSHHHHHEPNVVYNYYNNSNVPVTENIIHKKGNKFSLDPGAYNPYNNKLNEDPNLYYKIEKNKILRYRHLPYDKKLLRLKLKPTSPDNYKISGNGYNSLFKCSKNCMRNKQAIFGTATKELFHIKQKSYYAMINNPKRTELTTKSEIEIPKEIKYLSTTKPKIRKNRFGNNKLAFSSTQPRWENEEYKPIVLQMQKQKTKQSILKSKRPIKKTKKEIKSRLFENTLKTIPIIVNQDRALNYSQIFRRTTEKQLFKMDYWDENFGIDSHHSHFLTELPLEDFFRDSFRIEK